MTTGEPTERSLVVFADDWGRHPSSCQHLVKRLLPYYRVLWVNSIGTRAPQANGFTFRRGVEKIQNWCQGVQQINESLWVLDAPMLPWIGNAAVRMANKAAVTFVVRRAMVRIGIHNPTLLTTLPHVAWLLGDISARQVIYYCTDDYSHWPGADRISLLAAESKLQDQADLILAVSDQLMRRNEHRPCVYFPHAVDVDHFAATRTSVPSEKATEIPGPRIGFFGLIYEKLDFDLLSSVARGLPHASLMMIGPIDYCPESFASIPNVHLVGRQSFEDLPRWLASCSVLLLPYILDEMILQSSPLKLKECLATGLPTVCVDLPEARKAIPHIAIAKSKSEFVQLVGKTLQEHEPMDVQLERQASVQADTWDGRASQLRGLLESAPKV